MLGWLAWVSIDAALGSGLVVAVDELRMVVMHRFVGLKPNQSAFVPLDAGAMVLGFRTALPMHWLLIRLGWKERVASREALCAWRA
jgi:hypothetical protein